MLGYPFPGMGDFAVDTTHLAATLGLFVDEPHGRGLHPASRGGQCERTSRDWRPSIGTRYDVAADVTDADLDVTARAELALRGMVRDHRLDALTYQFMAFGDDERTSTLPFVAASRLMAEGIGFGGEGDLIAAAATDVLELAAAAGQFLRDLHHRFCAAKACS